jgi:hypothetical protein
VGEFRPAWLVRETGFDMGAIAGHDEFLPMPMPILDAWACARSMLAWRGSGTRGWSGATGSSGYSVSLALSRRSDSFFLPLGLGSCFAYFGRLGFPAARGTKPPPCGLCGRGRGRLWVLSFILCLGDRLRAVGVPMCTYRDGDARCAYGPGAWRIVSLSAAVSARASARACILLSLSRGRLRAGPMRIPRWGRAAGAHTGIGGIRVACHIV